MLDVYLGSARSDGADDRSDVGPARGAVGAEACALLLGDAVHDGDAVLALNRELSEM